MSFSGCTPIPQLTAFEDDPDFFATFAESDFGPPDEPVLDQDSIGGQNLTQLPPDAAQITNYALCTPGLSVIRAKITILETILGPHHQLDLWEPGAISPICLGAEIRQCPQNLVPSVLQRKVPHHILIDLLPWPTFRDRLLFTMTLPLGMRPRIARQDMTTLTLELMMAAKDVTGGVRVEGLDAASLDNWEIGQVFYSKFWWAVDADIVKQSNILRARRGLPALRYDLRDAM